MFKGMQKGSLFLESIIVQSHIKEAKTIRIQCNPPGRIFKVKINYMHEFITLFSNVFFTLQNKYTGIIENKYMVQ